MSLLPFTSHNIALPDGSRTIPNASKLLEEDGAFMAAARMLKLAFPHGLVGRSIVDLGCLEGGYTAGFARLGMCATGIEIRDRNLARAHYVKEKLHYPDVNLRFVQDDVNNVDRYGPVDAVWACGVLYHVENPKRLLEKINFICQRIVFLETHFAVAGPEGDKERLSPLCEHEGLPGRWYDEYPDGVTDEVRETSVWASWQNEKSFWIQREYLLGVLQHLGFGLVLEQYDRLSPNITYGLQNYCSVEHRALFVGIRA